MVMRSDKQAVSVLTLSPSKEQSAIRTVVIVSDTMKDAQDHITALFPSAAETRLLYPVSTEFTHDILYALDELSPTGDLQKRSNEVGDMLKRLLVAEKARIKGDD